MSRRALGWLLVLLLGVASPAHALTASDDFNRTENPLASGWTVASGFNTMKADGANAVASVVGAENVSLWTTDSFGADQFSEVVIGATSGGENGGPWVRGSTTAVQGYWLLTVDASTTWILKKITAGPTFTDLASGTWPAVLANGDTIRLEATGTTTTTFKVFRNGVEDTPDTGALSDSSSPHTSGRVGIESHHTAFGYTSWTGGDLAAANKAGGLVTTPILKGLVDGGLVP